MNSQELYTLAKKAKIPNFRVLMHDQTDMQKVQKIDNGIINLDRDNNGGTHWVCWSNIPKNPYILYFDSFGISPSDIIAKFLNTSGKPIKYNNSEMQMYKSIMCGWYCIYILDKLNKGKDLRDILFTFEQDPEILNEKIISKYANLLK